MDAQFLDEVLAYACRDIEFLRHYGHLLSVEDFGNRDAVGFAEREIIAGVILDNWKRFQEPIGANLSTALKAAVQRLRVPNSRREKIAYHAKRIYQTRLDSPDTIADSLIEMKRTGLLSRSLDEILEAHAAGTLSLEDFAAAIKKTEMLSAQLAPPATLFNMSENLEARIEKRLLTDTRSRGYYTYIDPLDELLVAPPKKGFFCILVALLKSGKSTFLTHITAAAALQGAKTIYLTLEDEKDLVEDRLDAWMSGIRYHDLSESAPSIRDAVKRFHRLTRGRIKVVDGTASSWRARDVDALYMRERANGFEVDAMILDYLMEVQAEKEHREMRWKMDEIARSLRQGAKRRNYLLWSAHQSSVSAETLAAREINASHVAEDRGLLRKVNLGIGLGRGEFVLEEQHRDRRALFVNIIASKYTQQGVGANIVGALDRGRIYEADLTDYYADRAAVEAEQP